MAKEKQLSTLKQNADRSIQMDKTEEAPINTQKEIAKTAGVSTGTVARYQEVKKKAPELVPKIKSGEMTIGGAYKAVKAEEKPIAPAPVVEQSKPTPCRNLHRVRQGTKSPRLLRVNYYLAIAVNNFLINIWAEYNSDIIIYRDL